VTATPGELRDRRHRRPDPTPFRARTSRTNRTESWPSTSRRYHFSSAHLLGRVSNAAVWLVKPPYKPAGQSPAHNGLQTRTDRSVATPTPGTVSRKPCVHPSEVPCTASMVLSPRAGYRTMKNAGSAINRTMKQTKAAISILLPQCLATDRGFRRRGLLIYDTRVSGPKFNRVHRIAPLVGGSGGAGTAHG
jgi:hypothetical protein